MTSVYQRRLRAEWDLLNRLALLNPKRLTGLEADDVTFRATLGVPRLSSGFSVAVPRWEKESLERPAHAFRVSYPVHFPAVPMELFLETPVFHPNIHPETGFVCLWERHRVSNTVEHAVHKLLAMLEGRLYNADAVHVMQPDALIALRSSGSRAQDTSLVGVMHDAYGAGRTPVRRRRLQ